MTHIGVSAQSMVWWNDKVIVLFYIKAVASRTGYDLFIRVELGEKITLSLIMIRQNIIPKRKR